MDYLPISLVKEKATIYGFICEGNVAKRYSKGIQIIH